MRRWSKGFHSGGVHSFPRFKSRSSRYDRLKWIWLTGYSADHPQGVSPAEKKFVCDSSRRGCRSSTTTSKCGNRVAPGRSVKPAKSEQEQPKGADCLHPHLRSFKAG